MWNFMTALWCIFPTITVYEISFNELTRLSMEKILVCLLIDDDEDDREIFQLALEQTDIVLDCIMVNNGKEALSILEENDFVPDFIFVDLNMPRMSGRECILELKKLDKLKKAHLVAYSTSSIQREMDELISLGATSFITKLPDIGELSVALQDCLTLGRQRFSN
jgi:CheY-like chemotaxis protein